VHLKMLYVAASAKAAIKHLSLWLPGRGRMGSGSAGLRSGLTVCSRQAVRPIIRPWMRRSTRFFREPRARRWHQRRIACQTRSIAPAPFVSAPRARLYQGGLQLHLRHLRPISWRHRCNASDVDDAGTSHRYRLLQPLLRTRRLWLDARGAPGDLASVRPGIGKAQRILDQGKAWLWEWPSFGIHSQVSWKITADGRRALFRPVSTARLAGL
jgi:hypothetical protein